MKTGFCGTFVIPWSKTELDGVVDAPRDMLAEGSLWRRIGDALRLDGPGEIVLLDRAEGEDRLRQRAARSVRRLVGAALAGDIPAEGDAVEDPLLERGFLLSDGTRTYTATEIEIGAGRKPLLMFVDVMPPLGAELTVLRRIEPDLPRQTAAMAPEGVICFAAGTMISTPGGPRPVEALEAGDRILTRDDGPQELIWTGCRQMSGARLFAMPHQRPVRIRAGALELGRPDEDLVVSPQHRVLVRGPAACALFGEDEVLVAAEDLINDRTILVDHALRRVTYVHLMLSRHQVVWANGVETESFHPAETDLGALLPDQHAALIAARPDLARDPRTYGAHARRPLTRGEAAILSHEGLRRH